MHVSRLITCHTLTLPPRRPGWLRRLFNRLFKRT
jgi:hypothetical protein